jgi:hypothetical protein
MGSNLVGNICFPFLSEGLIKPAGAVEPRRWMLCEFLVLARALGGVAHHAELELIDRR